MGDSVVCDHDAAARVAHFNDYVAEFCEDGDFLHLKVVDMLRLGIRLILDLIKITKLLDKKIETF